MKCGCNCSVNSFALLSANSCSARIRRSSLLCRRRMNSIIRENAMAGYINVNESWRFSTIPAAIGSMNRASHCSRTCLALLAFASGTTSKETSICSAAMLSGSMCRGPHTNALPSPMRNTQPVQGLRMISSMFKTPGVTMRPVVVRLAFGERSVGRLAHASRMKPVTATGPTMYVP